MRKCSYKGGLQVVLTLFVAGHGFRVTIRENMVLCPNLKHEVCWDTFALTPI